MKITFQIKNWNKKRNKPYTPDSMDFASLGIGLEDRKISNILTGSVQWGEAAGQFFAIEFLLRYIAQIDLSYRTELENSLKKAKPLFPNRWDCDPKYLIASFQTVFARKLSQDEAKLFSKYCEIRGKFFHSNPVGLLKTVDAELHSLLQTGVSRSAYEELKPEQIYEGLLRFSRGGVEKKGGLDLVRQYASNAIETLRRIILSSKDNKQ